MHVFFIFNSSTTSVMISKKLGQCLLALALLMATMPFAINAQKPSPQPGPGQRVVMKARLVNHKTTIHKVVKVPRPIGKGPVPSPISAGANPTNPAGANHVNLAGAQHAAEAVVEEGGDGEHETDAAATAGAKPAGKPAAPGAKPTASGVKPAGKPAALGAKRAGKPAAPAAKRTGKPAAPGAKPAAPGVQPAAPGVQPAAPSSPAAPISNGPFGTSLNELRKQRGLGALAENAALNRCAANHANFMSSNNIFKHDETPGLPGFTGASLPDRMRAVGIPITDMAENIYKGCQEPSCAYKAWVNSEGHLKNMLNPKVTHYGVAQVNGYWAMVVARV